ncbi:MAG: dTDP-4-dehydrorhamnose 3,5-epimerase [Acidobacteria bacterium]|nr:dTDP-4-dehydrorhamnose 3,5-epimerase [Acidobacteriota bacterium]
MTFEPTRLAGVFVVHTQAIPDARGYFVRTFSADDFRARQLNPVIAQANTSHNRRRGTLRGMHFQHAPAAEAKLVQCTRGAIYDVAVDVRPDSPTYRQWVSCELSATNRRALYLPEGCAHGFQTLEDDTDVSYLVSHPYAPDLADGFRYDDPAVGIAWPLAVTVISERDAQWPALVTAAPRGDTGRPDA